MRIWVLVTLNAGAVHEVEIFEDEPWAPIEQKGPRYYLVYEGDTSDGSTKLVGRGDGTLASCRHPIWAEGPHCSIMSCNNYIMKHEIWEHR